MGEAGAFFRGACATLTSGRFFGPCFEVPCGSDCSMCISFEAAMGGKAQGAESCGQGAGAAEVGSTLPPTSGAGEVSRSGCRRVAGTLSAAGLGPIVFVLENGFGSASPPVPSL